MKHETDRFLRLMAACGKKNVPTINDIGRV